MAVVAEVTGLAPGRALDVGCGEGADAVWLAARGWDVTALDVSGVALERARRHAADAGVGVRWLHAGLLEADLPGGGFDLVSAQYPALARTEAAEAERALVAAVAPGGVLLVVHHGDRPEPGDAHQVEELAACLAPADVAAVLDDGWQIEVDEVRPRDRATGAGAHHASDVVLRARRRRGT